MFIYTRDRAEKLSRSLEAQSRFIVVRLSAQQPHVLRERDGIRIKAAVYAEVWCGRALRLRVWHEWIDEGSTLL